MTKFSLQRLLYALATVYLLLVLILFLSGGIEGYSVQLLPFRTGPTTPAWIADMAFFTSVLVAIFGEKETRLISLGMAVAALVVFLIGTWPLEGQWQWLDVILKLMMILFAIIHTKRRG